jgi:FKBP-type peptidyl-prolyl cis-trans isomerase
MNKNFFIFLIVIVCLGVGAWALMQKKDQVDALATASPSVSESPSETVSPEVSATVMPSVSTSPSNYKIIKMDNGLQIQDIVVGKGPAAKSGDMVSVNYSGTFTDGKKFDSSYDRGVPFSFKLGAGQVIQGWDLGVVGMKVGGKRKLVIPPTLGYGPNDYGPIPGNSTLIFEVELVKIGN